MKEKWKRLWARRPRLSRGQKTARNFLLCLPILTLFWGLAGYPLPTAEMEFRRMERTHLMPRSEIIYNSLRDDPIQWGDLPELSRGLHGLIIGIQDGDVHVYESYGYGVFQSRRAGEGIAPVLLCGVSTVWKQGAAYVHRTGVLFCQTPEETDRAEVEISGTGRYREELHYRGEGWRLAPGHWLFAAALEEEEFFWDNWCAGGSYTLTLYREDGSLLLEKSGMLGEG